MCPICKQEELDNLEDSIRDDIREAVKGTDAEVYANLVNFHSALWVLAKEIAADLQSKKLDRYDLTVEWLQEQINQRLNEEEGV